MDDLRQPAQYDEPKETGLTVGNPPIPEDLTEEYDIADEESEMTDGYVHHASFVKELILRIAARDEEIAALKAENDRRKAPLSDEEWRSTASWPKGLWRDCLDKLIANRVA